MATRAVPPQDGISIACWPVALLIAVLAGCGPSKPYSAPERTAEEEELAQELSAYRSDFQRVIQDSSGDYALVAILDRDYTFGDDPDSGQFTRMLILHREQLDLDDYAFSRPGQEASEEGQLDTVLGWMFWITESGDIIFDDFEQPPGTEMVVEWFVEHGVPAASLHFGGNPCLSVDLSE
jgi:hypothetical protein